MDKNKPAKKPNDNGNSREERLKQALKANLARRKAQAKARDGDDAGKANTPENKR